MIQKGRSCLLSTSSFWFSSGGATLKIYENMGLELFRAKEREDASAKAHCAKGLAGSLVGGSSGHRHGMAMCAAVVLLLLVPGQVTAAFLSPLWPSPHPPWHLIDQVPITSSIQA